MFLWSQLSELDCMTDSLLLPRNCLYKSKPNNCSMGDMYVLVRVCMNEERSIVCL